MIAKDFVKWVYPAAKRVSDVSPIFTTAKAALESGWGDSRIGYNLFGVTKGSSWRGPTRLVTTTEYFDNPNKRFLSPEVVLSVECVGANKYKYKVKRLFRDYSSLEECLRDYLTILQKPHFSDAWPYRKDPITYVTKLQDDVGLKYATAPNYVQVMCQLFKKVERIVSEEGL